MMIHICDKCRYLLYNGNADMRKSFHGLAALVKYNMQCDVLNGDVYIFISKRRNAPLSCCVLKAMALPSFISGLKKEPSGYLRTTKKLIGFYSPIMTLFLF